MGGRGEEVGVVVVVDEPGEHAHRGDLEQGTVLDVQVAHRNKREGDGNGDEPE